MNQRSQSDTCRPQGLKPLLSKQKRVPYKIAVAISVIATSPAFSPLSRNAKGILAFVVRLTDCRYPTQSSWAFKSTIADHLGISKTTVYRGLKELESADLIHRAKQLRKQQNQRFSMSKIQLTEKACQQLGLLPSEDPTDPPHKGKETTTPSTSHLGDFYGSPSIKMEGGQYINLPSEDQRQSLIKKQFLTKTLFVECAHRRIPRDLVWLVQENGLSVSGLLKLMKQACFRGHQLSDIVSARRHCLKPHHGRSLYAYLRCLVHLPLDWRTIRRQSKKEAQKKQVATQALHLEKHREIQLQKTLKTLNFRIFSDKTRYFLFYEDAVTTIEKSSGRRSTVPANVVDGATELCQKALSGAWTEHTDAQSQALHNPYAKLIVCEPPSSIPEDTPTTNNRAQAMRCVQSFLKTHTTRSGGFL